MQVQLPLARSLGWGIEELDAVFDGLRQASISCCSKSLRCHDRTRYFGCWLTHPASASRDELPISAPRLDVEKTKVSRQWATSMFEQARRETSIPLPPGWIRCSMNRRLLYVVSVAESPCCYRNPEDNAKKLWRGIVKQPRKQRSKRIAGFRLVEH